jgi:uncharacterized Zn finger protein
MPPITDLLTEHTLLRLASPRAFIDGAATAEHGSVEFQETDDEHLRARVEDTEIYETELSERDGELAWSCTCGEAGEALCRHLVATALATWPEEVPDER